MHFLPTLTRHILILSVLSSGFCALAQTPHWIWRSATNAPGGGEQVVYFRKTFRTPPLLWNSRLTVSAPAAEVFFNGIPIAVCERWDRPVRTEVSVRLNQGENVVAIRARNRSDASGLLVHLTLNGQTNLVTDATWLVSTNQEPNWSMLAFNAAHWQPARSLGTHGMQPWGDVLQRAVATPPESLAVPPGFHVELLRSAEPGEGSWVCLAFDDRGRLIVSPEGEARPLLRFHFTDGRVEHIEPIPAPVRFAMGLLHAHGSLYANALGPEGAGLYRLTDANGNGQFDTNEVRLLKRFYGGSEHGYHAISLGPDGMIYVLNGNGTKPPAGLSARSPHRNHAMDVLSLNPDETQATGGASALQGYVARTDPDGKEWELWLGGLRNAYGFDFNPDGELFAFDSDMEWDWGTPWYRPARIVHCVSAGEYGWRDGTRLWPDYYEDSLPAVVDVGIGSPTGVRFGTKSRFPEKYRRALFAMDWSYGRIFAVHLTPDGASYRGTVETFLRGTPLNVTDLTFGPDGAMYFVTGGRGTQSGLYRVSHSGSAAEDAPRARLSPTDGAAAAARSLRRQVERFQGRSDPAALDFLWPHLGANDRFIRYAARVALESQEVARWKDRPETNATAALTALLALARVGGPETQGGLLKSLSRFPLDSLNEQQKLLKLRLIQISFLRQGKIDGDSARLAIEELDLAYPAQTWPLNRELSRLLIYLEAPDAVPKTIGLLAAAPTQEEQFHYVAQLRNMRHGWTSADRRRYFEWWLKPRESLARLPGMAQWFADARRASVDGAGVDGYLRDFRADAVATLSREERRELTTLLNSPPRKARLIPAANRAFVREWTMADLLPEIGRVSAGRNFERGRQAFVDAQCLACHRFGNDGGSTGPELTAAGAKYDRRSLLESLIEPSKVVSDQYQNLTVYLKDGESRSGRIVRETDAELWLETDPVTSEREQIPRVKVEQIRPSSVSPMPEGLLGTLSREEILDLLAYLASGGRADAPAFGPAQRP